jgi:hypothetical protein
MLSEIEDQVRFGMLTLVGGRDHSGCLQCAMKGHHLLVAKKHVVSGQLLRQGKMHLVGQHNPRYEVASAPSPPFGNQCHDQGKFVDHSFPLSQHFLYLQCHSAIYNQTDFAFQILDMDFLGKLPTTVGYLPI